MAIGSGKSSARGTLRQISFAGVVFVALALVIAQGAPQVRAGLEPFRLSAGDLLASRGNATMWDRLTRRGEKDRRIAELEAEVRELSRWKQIALTNTYQMEIYEETLQLLGEMPDQAVTARVVAEVDGPFSQTRLANAGALQGVSEGAVALNEGGLVGRVIQRGQRSSRILLVTDYNSRVPIVGEVSGARAVMYGARDGNGALTDLPERDGFVRGERILTSGEGGIFPQGLLVGRAYESGRDWRVELAMKDGSVDYVRLIPPIVVEKPEDDPVPEIDAAPEGVAGASVPATDSGGAR